MDCQRDLGAGPVFAGGEKFVHVVFLDGVLGRDGPDDTQADNRAEEEIKCGTEVEAALCQGVHERFALDVVPVDDQGTLAVLQNVIDDRAEADADAGGIEEVLGQTGHHQPGKGQTVVFGHPDLSRGVQFEEQQLGPHLQTEAPVVESGVGELLESLKGSVPERSVKPDAQIKNSRRISSQRCQKHR